MSNQPVEGDFRVKGNVAEFFYQGKWMSCDLRSPYERGGADMLEQVIEWIKECPNYDLETYAGLDRMIQDLKATMRPMEAPRRTFEEKQRSHENPRKWGIKKGWGMKKRWSKY